MLEKRLWPKLVCLFFVLMGCLVLYQIVSSPTSELDAFHVNAILRLYTQNYTGSYLTTQLPATDYNQLIDINFNFTILNLVCNGSSPLLLILVHSSPENCVKRQTIRETWGQNNDNIKILFMIGAVNSTDTQAVLEKENKKYNDFVQGSFLDTYRNITYKHVMLLKYVIYHCSGTKYVLKTDDDVFVNIPSMKVFLTVDLPPYGARKVLLCTPRRNIRVSRTYRSKWRVTFSEYPLRIYPTYCPGWTLLYSPDVVLALYREAQKTDYFWIDDIHITGTLNKNIQIGLTDVEPLVISPRNQRFIVDYSYNISKPFLYGRPNLVEKEIRALWKFVTTHSVPKSILKKYD